MKQKWLRLLPWAIVLLVIFAVAPPVFAQAGEPLGPQEFSSLRIPLFKNADPRSFFILLGRVINFLLLLAGIIAFFYILWGGFLYLTSGGDQTGAQKGRQMIANALIGIVIIFVSYALVNFFIRLIGREGTGEGTFGVYLHEPAERITAPDYA